MVVRLERVAVLILGAESCGNRMIHRSLIASGFYSVTECRHINEVVLPANGEPIVWLRSCPHAREWPDVRHMREILDSYGYRTVALVPMRDWWCAVHSQLARGHVRSRAEALEHLRYATTIFGSLAAAGIPFVPVSYEQAVTDFTTTIEHSLELLGIQCEILTTDTIEDRNRDTAELK